MNVLTSHRGHRIVQHVTIAAQHPPAFRTHSVVVAGVLLIVVQIAQILRIGVSVRRIESFFKEEDVPESISSLKRTAEPTESEALGIERASFVWNKPEDEKKDEKKKPKRRWLRLSFWAKEAVDVPATAKEEEEEETPFELRDIDVVFPSGKLTLVTGPTASGKSSLLHALLGEMTMSSATGRVLVPVRFAFLPSSGRSCTAWRVTEKYNPGGQGHGPAQ